MLENTSTVATAKKGIAALAVCYLVISLYKRHQNHNDRNGLKEVPSPPGEYPILGHILAMGKSPVERLLEWHRTIGPMYRISMGARKWILINDPVMAHELFVQRGSLTSSRNAHSFSHRVYADHGRGIVAAQADRRWKSSRTIALSILAPKMVEQYGSLLRDEADKLVDNLLDATATQNRVDPFKLLQLASLNVIMVTCFARRISSLEDEMFHTLIGLTDGFIKFAGITGDTGSFFPILRAWDLLSSKERMLKKFIREYRDEPFANLVRDALVSDQECLTKDIYDMKDNYNLDEKDVMILLSDLVVAGSDTTAVTLTWAFSILVHHPDVQKKIQAEIDAFKASHNGNLPRFADRDELPYTISVQKECMRFRTTTNFGVPHVATESFEYRGYYIPQGTTLISNMYAMHRNPDAYENPDTFKPERFINNTKTMMASMNGALEGRDHYNFGWGRRVCPGAHLAEVEIYNAFIRVLEKCDILPEMDENKRPMYPDINNAKTGGVTVTPENMYMRFLLRKT
ncbi:cytochrome P450 [Syncephalastrum racemosum]|uniref:Cytochrome P450 n=1 Tax=Syncephalastrum racemosum TaxID=13706 RepID=A0A1X2HPH5_SYNRA|nr:cytochrome P450 [Syncephalastrum racemosum]